MQKILYIFCLLASCKLSAQTATGSWYGRADVELAGIHNNYLTELVIRQKGNKIEGIFSYYFRDKYQSFFIHGRYNPQTREVIIENIPVIYYGSNSTVNSIDCNTNFIGVIIRSKVQSSLKGAFYHDARYKYTCPDLKVTYTLDREDKSQDSVLAMAAAAGIHARIWKPQADDVVVDVAPAVKDTVAATARTMEPPVVTAAKDTAAALAVSKPVDTPVVVIAKADPVVLAEEADKKKIAESFIKRKAALNKELDVESDSVRLTFYDNGEIDGDSISVFVNNQVVLTHQELAARGLTLYLHLDSTREVNEVSMFAENLGKYPPNTALMVVTDGTNRYEVFMSSSLTENATIRLKKVKGKL